MQLTYDLRIGKALVAQVDVRLEFQRDGSWDVRIEDLDTGTFMPVPRDDHDRIMASMWDTHADYLNEHIAESNLALRSSDRMAEKAA